MNHIPPVYEISVQSPNIRIDHPYEFPTRVTTSYPLARVALSGLDSVSDLHTQVAGALDELIPRRGDFDVRQMDELEIEELEQVAAKAKNDYARITRLNSGLLAQFTMIETARPSEIQR